MEAKIVSIKLKVGGREIEVSEDEARSIYSKLQEVFGKKDVVFIPYFYQVDRPYPEVPSITYATPGTAIEWVGTDPYRHQITGGFDRILC